METKINIAAILESKFDISYIWRIGYFKGETTNKRFPYIL